MTFVWSQKYPWQNYFTHTIDLSCKGYDLWEFESWAINADFLGPYESSSLIILLLVEIILKAHYRMKSLLLDMHNTDNLCWLEWHYRWKWCDQYKYHGTFLDFLSFLWSTYHCTACNYACSLHPKQLHDCYRTEREKKVSFLYRMKCQKNWSRVLSS